MSDNSQDLTHVSTVDLRARFATASTSDEAARIAAELERRRLHALAAYKLTRPHVVGCNVPGTPRNV
jgi:hypothetical protein